MADFWENQEKQNYYRNGLPDFGDLSSRDDYWKKVEEGFTQRTAEREENKKRWGLTLPDDQYLALNNAVASGKITTEEGYNLATSYALAQKYNLSPRIIRENLDNILKVESGDIENYHIGRSGFNFVASKVRSGVNTMRLGFLSNEWRDAELMGDAEAAGSALKEIEALERELFHDQDPDEKERNFFLRALGAAAESAPFTAYVAASAFFGSLLAPGVGTAAAFASSMSVTRGQEYRALRKAGATVETANNVSLLDSAVQAGLETVLGNTLSIGKGLSKAAGKTLLTDNVSRSLVEKAVANSIKTAHGRGLFLKTALKLGAEYAGESLEEGVEELLQEFTGIMALEAANALQQGGVETYSRDEMYQMMGDAFKGGAMASLFMGVPGTVMNSSANMRSYQQVKAVADTAHSETEFINATKDSEIFENQPEEERLRYQKSIYAAAASARERAESRLAAELKETAGLGEGYAEAGTDNETGEPIPLGELYRRNNGRLYTELDEGNNVFKAGDARIESDTNLDAHIRYSSKEDGSLTVTEYHVRPDRDTPEYRREFFKDFAETMADRGFRDIEWNPSTEKGVNIRQNLIDSNPYGTGLSYFPEGLGIDTSVEQVSGIEVKGDTAAAVRMKISFGEQMARSLPGSTEESRFGAMRLIDRIGRSYGYTFDKFVEKLKFDPGNIFTGTPGSEVLAENARAAQFAREGEKARAVRGALQPWKKLDADMKAVEHSIIYLDPARADLSTVVHELKHAVDNFLEKNDTELFKKMMDAAGAYDAKSGSDENTWRRERSAYAFETYLATGKAPAPELRNLFEQMKELLKDIINRLSSMRKLSPGQKEVFDELLSRADRVIAEADATESTRTGQNASAEAAAGKDTARGTKSAPEAARERYEGFTEEELKGTMTPEERREWHAKQNSQSFGTKNGQPIEVTGSAETDLKAVYALLDTKEAWDEFNEIGQALLDEFGGVLHKRQTLKSWDRAFRKIKPGEDASQITDINGMTLVQPTLEKAYEVMTKLKERGDIFVRGKDRYTNTKTDTPVMATHYRDFLLNVRLKNGAIFELQINTPQMLYAKEKMVGHTLYEIFDQIGENGIVGQNITEEEQSEIFQLCNTASQKLYDTAFESALTGASFNASSLDMSSELVPISDHFQERGAISKLLSEKTLNNVKAWPRNASGLSSQEIKVSLGSSKSGTSTAGTAEVNLSLGAAEAETTESSFTSVPSTNNIVQNRKSVNSFSGNNTPENEKRIEKARAKWDAAERKRGAEDQLTLQTGSEISGHYELGEAGSSTPSVDPDADFTQSEGFPVNDNGTSMNVGRDYTGGFSREAAVRMASDFDQRGIGIIVDSNGVTGSGNNRDISRRLAAKNGTDGKYTAYLASRPERWGFTKEDVAKYKHPTLYFVVASPGAYSPLYFDQFNRSGKKSVSPLETAIKMSYLVRSEGDLVNGFASALGNYESIGELYEDTQAATSIFRSLLKKGIVTENSYPDYVEYLTIKDKRQERITSAGKDFLESVMLGAVLEEDSIRSLALAPEIRKRIIKGLAAMVDNAALGEYSVIAEINQAVAVAVEVATNKKKYGSIEDYANQRELSLGQRVSTDIEVELSGRLLERTEYAFADTMGGLNALLREEARGQGDMFGGTSKDEILRRYLGIKARVGEIRDANNKTIENESAGTLEKVAAAMDNAGLAKGEVDGTLFQAAYHGSPYRFDRFDSSHMGRGEGHQAFGWGHYFAGKKEVAEHYRKALAQTHYYEGDRELKGNEAWAAQFLYSAEITPERVPRTEAIARVKELFKPERQQEFISLIEKLDNENLRYEEGQLYEADIPGDEEMLDWDKPFEKQPEKIRNIFSDITKKALLFLEDYTVPDVPTNEEAALYEAVQRAKIEEGDHNDGTPKATFGEKLYRSMELSLGSDKAASKALFDFGVKGIRFLDGSSRSAGEGSYNYVIFDDNDVSITQTFYQHDDERTAEVIDIDPETIVDENGNKVDLTNAKALTKWLKKEYQGREITISDDGLRLTLIRKGLEASVKRRGEEQRQMYAALDRLIEAAVYDDFEPGDEAHPAIEKQNIYYSAARIGEKLYSVRIKIDIRKDKAYPNYYKDHKIAEIKIEPSLYQGQPVAGASLQNKSSISEINIDVLNGKVKPSRIEEGILFQLDDNLIEDASQYDNWRGFRDSVESGRTLFQTAYHGSPYRFPAFDSSHMGSGTGVQMFGWGHYASKKKRTADYYRKLLLDSAGGEDGNETGQLYKVDIPNNEEMLDWNKTLEKQHGNLKRILREAAEDIFDFQKSEKTGSVTAKIERHYLFNDITLEANTSEELYNKIAGNMNGFGLYYYLDSRLRSVRGTSRYLHSLGIKGISHLDDSVRSGGERNYVIFDDNDIEITKTYYQLEEEAADNAWYRSLWNDSKKIYKETLFQGEEEKTSRAGELDKRFLKRADREYLTEVLKAIHAVINDKTLEPAEGEERGEYERVRRLEKRIRNELPNAGSVTGMAAQVNSGRLLSSGQYERLRKFIREHTREYRSVFADITGEEEYLEDLADAVDGEPRARLADPKGRKINTEERLKTIAREIDDPALKKAIENGEISFDDPVITAFEQGERSGQKKNTEALAALEKEMGEDFARLANDAKRRMVTLYEAMLAEKEKVTAGKDKLKAMLEDGIDITGFYEKKARLENASYEQAYKAFDDFAKAYGIEADVREALGRREARYEERVRQQGLQKRRRAIKALKDIKRTLIKRITRNVSFETIGYDQALIIKAIQRIFEPSIIDGVDKWIGGKEGPLLREVWSAWYTDETYRDELLERAGEKRAGKITAILNKNWDFITTADKKALIRLLPKENFVKDLALEELIRENEESVQLDIDERVINGKVYYVLGAALEKKIKGALGEELYNRIQNKSLSEWSLREAEELAGLVDNYTVEGRRELRAKKEARRLLEQKYRSEIIAAVGKTGIVINGDDTPEEKARKEKKIETILSRYASGKKKNTPLNSFFDANLRRFTQTMDGGRKGIFTSLLYWGENDAFNNEQRRIAARRMVIDAVMKEHNISLDELCKTVEIKGLEGTDLYRVSGGKITVDDLLYILRGYENEETRKAITYGNLSNATERNYYKERANNLEEIEGFANKAHGRLMLLLDYANEFFAREENKKFLALSKVIGEDYERNGERMNEACIDMFNRPMWRVETYVPMNRREQSGGVNENRVIEDLLGIEGAGQRWVGKGFTEKRINISPYHQAPIELGLYRTWATSVQDTEHLLAYGPLVQTLNAVFKGYDSGAVTQAINDRWGKEATKRIADTIAEFANPDAKARREGLDNVVRTLRGKTATAYLAWKTSGVIKQLVTSPWPYLQEISPPEYLRASLEVAGGFGKVNEFIREKSMYMKTRDFDPMVKLIREAMKKNDNALLHGIDRFNSLGMKGLAAVDWACVAPGWLAKYRRELANVAAEQETEYQKHLEKYHGSEWADVLPTEESKVNKALAEIMSDGEQDAEAAARADDAVRRMQPSSRQSDLAPLFKNKSEIANAVLQFQSALNVIWQNIRYDLPLAVKEKEVWTVVGMVTGYAAAGICLGLLLDDEDEEKKKERNTAAWILYNSLTQFTDAVPVIGEEVSTLAESMIFGKRTYRGEQNFWPVLQKAFGGLQNFGTVFYEDNPEKQKEKLGRAAGNLTEAFALYLGLPASGVKELGRAAGIGDGDGTVDFNPESFLGRRK